MVGHCDKPVKCIFEFIGLQFSKHLFDHATRLLKRIVVHVIDNLDVVVIKHSIILDTSTSFTGI
jgi:hypothetical protein